MPLIEKTYFTKMVFTNFSGELLRARTQRNCEPDCNHRFKHLSLPECENTWRALYNCDKKAGKGENSKVHWHEANRHVQN